MKYIKLFESFTRDAEERMNDILDRMSRGEELSQYDKDTLSALSNNGKVDTVIDEVMEWLNSNYGNLHEFRGNYKSFNKTVDKITYHNNDMDVVIEVEAKQNRIAYVQHEIFEQLYRYFKLDDNTITDILIEWLKNTYKINVASVNPVF